MFEKLTDEILCKLHALGDPQALDALSERVEGDEESGSVREERFEGGGREGQESVQQLV